MGRGTEAEQDTQTPADATSPAVGGGEGAESVQTALLWSHSNKESWSTKETKTPERSTQNTVEVHWP